MRTRICSRNPFGHDRHGFGWEHVRYQGRSHLDLGCHEGMFLASLRAKGIARLVGADLSAPAIQKARQEHPDLEFHHLSAGQKLPFADASFDSVSLLDVLEHVADQRALLAEVRRVLVGGGTLIVTVPGQHLFSFMDLGNLKFRFPRLHRWYYCRSHSLEEYRRRYQANPDGLVGDVEAAKMWHEHFSPRRLAALLESAGLTVVLMDGAGLFFRPLSVLRRMLRRIGPVHRALGRLGAYDSRAFGRANLFCVAAADTTAGRALQARQKEGTS
jgi:SAM-dependent methyltransferase